MGDALADGDGIGIGIGIGIAESESESESTSTSCGRGTVSRYSSVGTALATGGWGGGGEAAEVGCGRGSRVVSKAAVVWDVKTDGIVTLLVSPTKRQHRGHQHISTYIPFAYMVTRPPPPPPIPGLL